MNILTVDEILAKLSIKFNKIYQDREFVCSLCEDFQVILKNKHKCCVVVFPALGPSYLKALRYQAKLFDLAVFVLYPTKVQFIAVCHKAFLRSSSREVKNIIHDRDMFESVTENGNGKTRKKRPERQLYIPPAQRKIPLIKESSQKISTKVKKNKTGSTKSNEIKQCIKSNISKERINDFLHDISADETELSSEFDRNICKYTEKSQNCNIILNINYSQLFWKYRLPINCFLKYLHRCEIYPIKYFYLSYIQKIPIYNNESSLNILNILQGNYVLWQPKINYICEKSDKISANSRSYSQFCFLLNFAELDIKLNNLDSTLIPVLVTDCCRVETYEKIIEHFNSMEFSVFDMLWNSQCCDNSIKDVYVSCVQNMGNKANVKNCSLYQDNITLSEINQAIDDENEESRNLNIHNESQIERSHENLSNLVELDESSSHKLVKDGEKVKENNIKNALTNLKDTTNDLINMNVQKSCKKNCDHEQEIEIMRKTKERINRRTRPIMKYVDDSKNTLKIGKNDNVNNWEDLFDEDGQLQEELFKEITHKVGQDITIVQAKEDYSEYFNKPIEELEHMVELYDFPSTLATHDLIHAFNDIKSDAMYIKWVDDTHAILVLGSFKQAQRAIELDNPLIKVRPMTAASRMSLSIAFEHDLKPAMKRPPTNLQIARRLIMMHLGTKSRVSEEQNIRERNDLKAAKEMKKLAKRNEQDAWEGNLKSCVYDENP